MADPAFAVVENGRIARYINNAPKRTDDGDLDVPLRQNRLGELFSPNPLTPAQVQAAEDSQYICAVTGTRGTGAAIGNATGVTYANTQALLIVDNLNNEDGPDVILDYLDINIDAVGTAGTFWHLYYALDQFPNGRWSSAGEAAAYNASGKTPPNIRVALGGSPVAKAPSNNVHDLGHNLILNGVGVAFQSHRIKFGAVEAAGGGVAIPTTNVVHTTWNAPAVVVHPGYSFVINEYQTARTAAEVGELFLAFAVR